MRTYTYSYFRTKVNVAICGRPAVSVRPCHVCGYGDRDASVVDGKWLNFYVKFLR